MKILVTGSKGQLGSDMQDISSQYPELIFDFTDIEELDLTDANAVDDYFAKSRFDFCINCAAYTAVDNAEDEALLALKINNEAVGILANACKTYHTKLIHISTDYVFNGTNFKPYNEDDQTSPQSSYGYSKLKGEETINLVNPGSMIIRTSWLYSSYGHNFVKTMIRLANERNEISVVADQVGTPTYAYDLADAILQIITRFDKSQIKGIYHFSNEGAISWYDFAVSIMQLINSDCEIKAIESKDFPAKAKRPFYSVLSKTKIKSDFNIKIPYWHDSLKIAIQKINNQLIP